MGGTVKSAIFQLNNFMILYKITSSKYQLSNFRGVGQVVFETDWVMDNGGLLVGHLPSG